MKLRLSRHGGVANPRDTYGYRCGLRLAMTRNASVSFCAAIRGAEHQEEMPKDIFGAPAQGPLA
ncbi:hypothetical protein [Verminephrobacter aporrectodeae]|uniref:hypothetical protein n=1 Tax=Verminephrobacter aporrectodeae TaxID=1110389 RepID=UPI0003041561|nr:hypothetical protein [Verminephrobacter aporrectodeae]